MLTKSEGLIRFKINFTINSIKFRNFYSSSSFYQIILVSLTKIKTNLSNFNKYLLKMTDANFKKAVLFMWKSVQTGNINNIKALLTPDLPADTPLTDGGMTGLHIA